MAVATNLTQFGNNIQKRAKKADENIIKIVQKTIRVTVSELYRRTPVDTGLARANWITSNNAPSTKVTSTKHSPLATAGAVASRLRPEKDINVWVANNVPYIELLENGYSQQAPKGFMKASIAAGNRVLRKKGGLRVMGR